MDHQVPQMGESSSNTANPRPDQVPDNSSRFSRNNNIAVDQQLSADKLTSLLKLGDIREDFAQMYYTEANAKTTLSHSQDDGFHRQQGFAQRDMELDLDEEMEIQNGPEESDGDYGEDFQFFHHKLLLQQHLGGHLHHNNEFGGVNSFGSQNGHINMGSDAFHVEGCDDNGIGNNFSENPFVFPDGVMEYGEPQFFPGNCVGYLETILEETDEEETEEEGCSGRHWWTADSDTDTDSVIRVDNSNPNSRHSTQQSFNNNNQPTVQTNKCSKLKSVDNVEDLSEIQSTFRTSASSRPFELEDLHLLDQLDLAFEETLMEPRRRSGFAAFGHQLHLLDQPLEKHVKLFHHEQDDGRDAFLHRDGVALKRSASHDGERTVFSSEDAILPQSSEKKNVSDVEKVGVGGGQDGESRVLGNAESKETFGSSLSPSSSSDSEPHEVAEEDFFYSSPGSEESEEADGSSSDDSEKNVGVVLAEFSLSAITSDVGFGENNNSFSSGSGRNVGNGRRSLESSKLKSFRSFDSLNSLSGTELLFSKADTFPSFHYIKEDVEPGGGSSSGSPVSPASSPRCNLTSCSTNDVPGSTGTSCCHQGTEDPSSGRRGEVEGEGESRSLPLDHNHSVPGFPPTFNTAKKAGSYSSSTTSTTSTSSCNSATGMIHSSENLSEADSGIGIGLEGGSHPNAMGEKRSSAESFTDDLEPGEIAEGGESAKDYISKSEFALNPLVFSSLSSASDGGSNSPSISVPSLNNNESYPSADCAESELNGNQGCVTAESRERNSSGSGAQADTSDSTVLRLVKDKAGMGPISHNSLSNFHLVKVDEKNSSQIESPQPQQSNHKKELEQLELGTISSSIPFEAKLPISINDQTKPNKRLEAAVASDAVKSSHHLPVSPTISSSSNHNREHQHCSTIKPNPSTTGLHPYLDPNLRSSNPPSRPDIIADEAKAVSNFADNITCSDNPNSTTSSEFHSSAIDTPNPNPNVPFDPESQSQKTLLSSPSSLGERMSRNQPNHCKNSEPSLATESHNMPISPHKNNNGTPTFVRFQQSEEKVVGVQVPDGEGGPQISDYNQDQTNNDTSDLQPSDHISIVDDSLKTSSSSSSRRDSLQRERSNSESEFEYAESAVELDSIALAYAIVNSPKLHSGSSSPTKQLNESNIGHGDNLELNGESGPESASTSSTLSSGEIENRGNDGMQNESHTHSSQKKDEQKRVNVISMGASPCTRTPHKHFTSPLSSHYETAVAGQSQSHAPSNGSSVGNNSIEPSHCSPSKADAERSSSGLQNANISLHHHQSGTAADTGLVVVDADHGNKVNQSEISGVSPPQNEALGQQKDNGIKPSSSVNSGYSSSVDVVVHRQGRDLNNYCYEPPPTSYVNKSAISDKHSSSGVNYRRVSPSTSDEEVSLVAAAVPIHPVHIGVAEVKKFSQLHTDSSTAARKLHHPSSTFHPSHPFHHQRHGLGLVGSESEDIIRVAHSTKSPSSTGYTSKSKTEEDCAILGQSNFGHTTSHPRNGSNVRRDNSLDPKSQKLGSSSTHSGSTTDSSQTLEFPSYGFPSTSHSSYPTNSFLHSAVALGEGDLLTHQYHHEIETSREKSYKRSTSRDPLHLEDIKCGGIHPEQFTIPFGVYSAAVLAAAPSLPSTRFVFVNEKDSSELTHGSLNTTTINNIPAKPTPNEGITSNVQKVVSDKVVLLEPVSKKSRQSSGNPLNGVGVCLTNSCPLSNYPDVLVVKQTHSSSPGGSGGKEEKDGEGDKTSQKETEVPQQTGPIRPRMEVDTNAPTGGGERRSTSPSGPIPIKTRTYGPRNEVEVVHMSRHSRTPSPAPGPGGSFPFSSSLKQTQPSSTTSSEEWQSNNKQSSGIGIGGGDPPVKVPGSRTRVHFSPIVSEISWRESYIDQGSEFSGSTEDIVSSGFCFGESGQTVPEGYSYPYASANYGESGFGDSLVRPLQVNPSGLPEMAEVFSNPLMEGGGGESDSSAESPYRHTSPGPIPGKGQILVEKVQMRSSFLSGADEELDSDEDLERKLTMDVVYGQDSANMNRARSPVDEDHLEEDYLMDVDGPRKEGMTFPITGNPGASSHHYHQLFENGALDLYEDVSVAIEPQESFGPGCTNLSMMMPDLLSQCENAAHAQTHIDVCIEEQVHNSNSHSKPPLKPKPLRNKSHSPTPQHPQQQQQQRHSASEIPPPPVMDGNQAPHHQPQQQIFPKIFAEEPNGSGGSFGKLGKSDSKNNSSSSLTKKKSSKGFGLGSGSKKWEQTPPKERDNKESFNKEKKSEGEESSKENKTGKGSKPGFFERLSKIRLSGSKPKKQKVHPKMDELQQQPLKSQNAVNFNGSSTINGNNGTKSAPGQGHKLPAQPILKKTTHSPVIPNYTPTDYDTEPEPAESHQAFENILDEIAGIENIKMRMGKSTPETTSVGSGGTTPERQQPPPKEMRSFAKRKQFYSNATESSTSPSPPVSPNGRSLTDLDRKLSQFKEDASKNRVVISQSHPDLELIEDMVRQASSPEPLKTEVPTKTASKEQKQGKSPESKKSPKKSSMSETGQKNEREWYKLLKSAAEKYYYRGSKDKDVGESGKDKNKSFTLPSGHKTGIVETDLDTGTSREMLDAELLELDKKYPLFTASTSEIPSSTYTAPITTMAATSPGTSTKARSLTNLSTRLPLSIAPSNFNYDDVDHLTQGELNEFDDERAKSYEFLLDDNQKCSSVPPENKLRTETRQLSQHELSVQKSLQRIQVPEWYKKHEAANNTLNSRTSTPERPYSTGQDGDKGGTLKILNRRSEFGSSGGLAGGWAGLSAFKAPSMSSLQNVGDKGRYAGSLNRNSNFVRGRPTTMSSRESLTRFGSASHSPSAYDARSSFTYGIVPFAMTRFGHGRMSNNSGTVTPTSTAESNASTTNPSYVKKPYLGWRSQERLNQQAASGGDTGPPKLSVFLPVEERLAADLLRSRIPNKTPISDRPPLPKRSEKTSLTKTSNSSQAKSNNSIPPPNFDDSLPTMETSTFTTTQRVGRAGSGRSSDVHDSIREVTQAISQYVGKGKETVVTPPKPQPRKKSPGRQAIWMESSFVGRKPANKQ